VPGYPRPSDVAALTLGEVAAALGMGAPEGGAAVSVTGITHDSTLVRPGDLYAAVAGGRRHGAEFAAHARDSGAVAILTDRVGAGLAADSDLPALVVEDPRAVLGSAASAVYGDPTRDLTVIGITGTAGKTTAAYLIESGLAAAGRSTCMIGTVETRIAGLRISSVRTTPEATDLHALFAIARDRGADAAVMEVSSHALAYGRVGGVRFDIGAFTNFGVDHLDFHTDVDDYFAAKAKLFDGRCRVEVLNWDDPAVRRLARPGRVTFSALGDHAATWWAEKIGADGFGQHFLAIGPGDVHVPARVALPGRHNVANALLALACLVGAGIDPTTAAEGIAACPGVPGRLERVDAPGPVLGVVDYAHKPDAIVAALAALREGATGRLICVIGAGGDRDAGKRPTMGAAAAAGADLVVVTDDNPRSEDPAVIRAAVLAGARATPGAVQVVEVAGRRDAIAAAVSLAAPGDIIAVLGKGHETGQETAGTVAPFDDRVELAAALAHRFGSGS
jgi:UDP-N-acetylmuramoyl-L-alanyl-D-glutamate--2,6-diaminopimelate ligase